ncbi:hypothetical protein NONO_c18320 [Nocardia nova SH22a]|uniref:Uncharacterized protein n=1 Tax=Nocardia nova SH22a TaxID=1415166 RepID=W5TBN0_9NOCA|nr:hypothetical protein NONO_c18320 [Nocardia nova SH22a]
MHANLFRCDTSSASVDIRHNCRIHRAVSTRFRTRESSSWMQPVDNNADHAAVPDGIAEIPPARTLRQTAGSPAGRWRRQLTRTGVVTAMVTTAIGLTLVARTDSIPAHANNAEVSGGEPAVRIFAGGSARIAPADPMPGSISSVGTTIDTGGAQPATDPVTTTESTTVTTTESIPPTTADPPGHGTARGVAGSEFLCDSEPFGPARGARLRLGLPAPALRGGPDGSADRHGDGRTEHNVADHHAQRSDDHRPDEHGGRRTGSVHHPRGADDIGSSDHVTADGNRAMTPLAGNDRARGDGLRQPGCPRPAAALDPANPTGPRASHRRPRIAYHGEGGPNGDDCHRRGMRRGAQAVRTVRAPLLARAETGRSRMVRKPGSAATTADTALQAMATVDRKLS